MCTETVVKRGLSLCDFLYAAGEYDQAERLDMLLDEYFESADNELEYHETESWDDGDRIMGIEDVETDECDDEPVADAYWEPHMLVATEME